MAFKKFNISKPEKYMKDGAEKTYWANIGILTEFTNDQGKVSRIIEIPAISLKANVFPIEPRPQQGGYQTPQTARTQPQTVSQPPQQDTNEEILDVDSIPF